MLPNSEGKRVPHVSFRVIEDGRWKEVTTEDLFNGKTVVVFSLPGAFTPTCSSAHVPRYEELFPVFAEHGVDEVLCVSVNDTFVMNAWAEDQGADRVRFIPDGNGEFTEGMGMLVNKAQLGFGKRSWRYSMLVRDGVVEKMFIEPERDGDPYEVSDADTMLDYLAKDARRPDDVFLLTRPGCPHCARATAMLEQAGLEYEEVRSTPRRLRAVSGKASTPQIFINGVYVGGADELEVFLGQRR